VLSLQHPPPQDTKRGVRLRSVCQAEWVAAGRVVPPSAGAPSHTSSTSNIHTGVVLTVLQGWPELMGKSKNGIKVTDIISVFRKELIAMACMNLGC